LLQSWWFSWWFLPWICLAPVGSGLLYAYSVQSSKFRALDLARLKRVMVHPVIVDLRNIYRADQMKHADFRYVTVGRRD
jgi:hypothetical protein